MGAPGQFIEQAMLSGFNQGEQQRQQRKELLNDEERQGLSQQYIADMGGLRKKLATLEPGSPAHAQVNDDLNALNQKWSALYHPENNHNPHIAMQELGQFFSKNILHRPQQAPMQTAETRAPEIPASNVGGVPFPAKAGPLIAHPVPVPTKEEKQQQNVALMGRVAEEATPAPTNTYLQVYQQAIAAGATPQEAKEAVAQKLGIRAKPVAEKPETWTPYGKPVQDEGGAWVQPFRNREGQIENRPTPEGYKPPAPVTHPSNAAVQRTEYARALGKSPDELTFQDEQNLIRLVKQAGAGTTTASHVSFQNINGQIVPVRVETSSSKSFGGAPLPSAPSSTPQRSPYMAVPKPKGLVESGNLPIWNRPTVRNADGTHSSEYSTSFADDQGREVLVPTVVNGKFLTPDGKKPPEGSPEEKAMFQRAWQHYIATGENLGKFDNAANANSYSNILHNRGNPPTAGDLKKKAATVAPQKTPRGMVQVGEPIGERPTATQATADKAVNAATGLVSLADDALAAPSAAKDKNLALAIIRGAAGRVNMQEYNIMTQRAGLGNTLEAWANSAATGQLPADIRKQLVDVAHSSLKAAQAGQAQSRKPAGSTVSSGWTAPANAPAASQFPEGHLLYRKGSPDPIAVQRGGQWAPP